MPDFNQLLSKPMDQVEKPKPFPAGTYTGHVVKYDLGESGQKKTPYVRFTIQPTAAGDDVDPSVSAGLDFTKRTFNTDFYLTTDAEYRLKDFLESCKIPVQGRTFGESIPETINAPVLFSLTQKPSQDGTELYSNITKITGQ